MKNVIITGADGFVGSYTVKYFIENSCKVLALDMSEAPRRLTVALKFIFRRFFIGNKQTDILKMKIKSK